MTFPRGVWVTAVVVALPALLVAIDGSQHPPHLTYAASNEWYSVHLPGIVVVPLIGGALAWTMRGRRDPTAWLVRLAAYGFATFYTALDVISGVAAGYVTHHLGPGVPRPDAVAYLFRIGTPLGRIGSIALMCCALLLVLDALVEMRLAGLGSVLLLPGAYLVHEHHIFPPLGVTGLVLLGLGTSALVLGRYVAESRGRFRPAHVWTSAHARPVINR